MKPSQILLLTLLWAVSISNSVAQEITMFPGLFKTNFGHGFKLTPLVVSIGAGALSIGFTIAASKHRKKAILRYNHIKSDDTFLLHIGQTHNGVGLVVTL